MFFFVLIISGAAALSRRRISFSQLARENVSYTIFFVYCFLAIFWSDFPFVASKRWFKTLGHPIIALLILTDPDPILALRFVLKRCGIVLLPLSVLFIKYLPWYGRGFDSWTGQSANNGIALNKNELGYSCFIFGAFFLWNFLVARRIADRSTRRKEEVISLGFLSMALWLLSMSNSATSLVSLVICSGVIVALGFRFVSKRFFGTYVMVAIFLAATAELSIGIYAPTLKFLGRNPTLTDRTFIWSDTLALADSPILGVGFESFWLGPRLDKLWSKWWWHPTQAHNGYIETYLNLGSVGVLLLVILLISTFRKISSKLTQEFDFARLRMGFLFAIIFYNFSEATFKGVAFVWTIFHIIALDVPARMEHSSQLPNRTQSFSSGGAPNGRKSTHFVPMLPRSIEPARPTFR